MTKKLTLGGDTEFNITNNEVKSRFFAMFDVDPSTKVKAKWEDKDKSVSWREEMANLYSQVK